MPGFVHLHVHSSYSLLEGALPIARLCELAKSDRQPALALTDTDNMFGALEFSDKMAAAGIQPIVGCALAVDFGDQEASRAGEWVRNSIVPASCSSPRARVAIAASCGLPPAPFWRPRRTSRRICRLPGSTGRLKG
jgi:predicted metal-dependent phosphoesterase TrpH